MTAAPHPASEPTSSERHSDVLAIGLGPFNLGLAALAEPTPVDVRVLESRSEFSWHPGMMLDGATIQVPFMADLVTMADPTNPYSFLAYLKRIGRLYPFYIRESFYPLRAEYDAYCRDVAHRLGTIAFNHHVEELTYDAATDRYCVQVRTADGVHIETANHVVVGVGTVPTLPDVLAGSDRVLHSADYLHASERVRAARRICVVGSGQSAAEIFYDLLANAPEQQEITWVTRSERFFPMEYTKLTLEMTSPDYMDHFHGLDEATRSELVRAERQLYKGISGDLVDAIYDLLYQRSLDGPPPVRLAARQEVTGARPSADGLDVTVQERLTGAESQLNADLVISATGYESAAPELIRSLPHVSFDAAGRPNITRDFTLDGGRGRLFIQNGADHTHSVSSPDLGMGPYRNSIILNRIVGREVYPVEERIAFQSFGEL